MKLYNLTDEEFAGVMCGKLDILRAHGLAARCVPILDNFNAGPTALPPQRALTPNHVQGPAPITPPAAQMDFADAGISSEGV